LVVLGVVGLVVLRLVVATRGEAQAEREEQEQVLHVVRPIYKVVGRALVGSKGALG
jgi:hypothetical protein